MNDRALRCINLSLHECCFVPVTQPDSAQWPMAVTDPDQPSFGPSSFFPAGSVRRISRTEVGLYA